MAQDRKVFVGGVPQDLDQDDIYGIFSEYAGVKKAWLQKCRTQDDGNGSNTCPPQNHRGFGFVIFHDALAIDELLGNNPSRFIILRSGAKLEVKRALSSNKMGQETVNPQAPVQENSSRNGRGSQQGKANKDLTSNHVVGTGPQQRSSPQQTGGSSSRGNRSSAAANANQMQQQTAAATQAAAAASAAQVPWPAAGGDNGVLRQLSLMYHSSAQGLLAAAAVAAHPVARSAASSAEVAAQLEALHAYSGLPQHVQVPTFPAATVKPATQPPGLSATAMPATAATQIAPHQSAQPDGFTLHAATVNEGAMPKYHNIRDALMGFYCEHYPEKTTDRELIDFICWYFSGKEEELDAALKKKYGVGLKLPQAGLVGQKPKVVGPAAAPATRPATNEVAGMFGAAPGSRSTSAATSTAGTSVGGEIWSGLSSYSSGEPAYAPTASVEVNHPQSPDFSWVDQIVADDLDFTTEVWPKEASPPMQVGSSLAQGDPTSPDTSLLRGRPVASVGSVSHWINNGNVEGNSWLVQR